MVIPREDVNLVMQHRSISLVVDHFSFIYKPSDCMDLFIEFLYLRYFLQHWKKIKRSFLYELRIEIFTDFFI